MFGKYDFNRCTEGPHLGIEFHGRSGATPYGRHGTKKRSSSTGTDSFAARCLALLILGLLALQAAPAQANFCKKVMTERARTEAKNLARETFSQRPPGEPTIDFVGNEAYNADIITCNRKRDNKGNKVEKAIKARHKFAKNLEARSIKGKYFYYATSALAYAYELRREDGEWIVRMPMRFHWPTARKTDMIDISMELVEDLNDPALGALCDPKATVFDKNGKDVTRGYIPIENKAAGIKGTDTVFQAAEAACRVKRSTKHKGLSILNWLRRFFADAVTETWNRPGFRIEPVLLDHGEGTQAEINAWDKDGITWELRLNLKPSHRASYKRWAFKWNHMYTGLPADIIAHEFGHKLGFDDEYGWGPDVTRSQRACDKRPGKPEIEYIMCSQWSSRGGAKGVYPWIATRRYAIAQELTCKKDTDCGTGLFCAKGAFTIGRNECQPLKAIGGLCDRDTQCATDRCALGSCAADHECVTDGDCGTGKFCKIGLGDLDRNTCRAKLADGTACTSDKQCSSSTCSGWRPQDGQVSGICYTANSKKAGVSCKIDLECATGACNSAKRCVCKKDTDCAGGQYCDKGFDLKQNSCRTKLAKGQACGKYGDLGVSRRCKSGKCSTKTGLGVLGVTTIFCQ